MDFHSQPRNQFFISVLPTIERLDQELALIPDPQERLVWITGLGRRLDPLPPERRRDEMLVPGCVSRVWLEREIDAEGRLELAAAADSPLVLGLVAVLLRVSNGQASATLPDDLPKPLETHRVLAQLTPTRLNGLQQVWRRIRGEI